jgi:hypothetical protein
VPPARQGGMEPRMTGQRVGGSSSTGAKLSERTWRGSTDGRSAGGSMKMFIMSSRALQNAIGNDRGVAGGITDRGLGLVAAGVLELERAPFSVSGIATFSGVCLEGYLECGCGGIDVEARLSLVKTAGKGRRCDLFVLSLLFERWMERQQVVKVSISIVFTSNVRFYKRKTRMVVVIIRLILYR